MPRLSGNAEFVQEKLGLNRIQNHGCNLVSYAGFSRQLNPPSNTPYTTATVERSQGGFLERSSRTFHEDAWGKASDFGQDGEEGPDTGPLRLPVLKDLEDALAHTSGLSFSVSLQSRTGSRGQGSAGKASALPAQGPEFSPQSVWKVHYSRSLSEGTWCSAISHGQPRL